MFEYAFRVTGVDYDETVYVDAATLPAAERQVRDEAGIGRSVTLLYIRDLAPQECLAF